MKSTYYSLLRCAFVLVASCLLVNTLQAELLSSFEQDLTVTSGGEWAVQGSTVTAYTTTGATEGAYALETTRGTGFGDVLFHGSTAAAALIGDNDSLFIDVTVPDTAEWRQVFFIGLGDGLGWTQLGQDAVPGATTTLEYDLAGSGIKAAAAAGPSWWQMRIVTQGGDLSGASEITTIIDNIRFGPASIPEPTAAVLALLGVAAALRRR